MKTVRKNLTVSNLIKVSHRAPINSGMPLFNFCNQWYLKHYPILKKQITNQIAHQIYDHLCNDIFLYLPNPITCCRKHWEEATGRHAWTLDGALMNPMGMPFMSCKTCRNKRCPKATNCQLECTNSNKSGQEGCLVPETFLYFMARNQQG